VDQEQQINQTNQCIISKELSDKIELTQSNTSTVQGDINDELKITQTNTNIIRKKNNQNPEPVIAVAKDAEAPQVLLANAEQIPVVNGNINVEPVLVQVNPLPAPSIPKQVFWVLDIVGGKVKAQIANQFFKTKLLQLISRARQFLQLGKVAEAIAVLTVIADELEYINDSCSYEKPPVKQVRRILVEAEKTLAELL